jgi:adenylate cyclase
VLQRFAGSSDGNCVLIVEDDPGTRESLRRVIEREGWSSTEAENGRAALEKIEISAPALILLDLMMPEMDGFEFLDELRDRPDAVEIPVVVLTAMELTEEDRARLNGDVARVLSKGGGSAAELSRELRRLVGRPD